MKDFCRATTSTAQLNQDEGFCEMLSGVHADRNEWPGFCFPCPLSVLSKTFFRTSKEKATPKPGKKKEAKSPKKRPGAQKKIFVFSYFKKKEKSFCYRKNFTSVKKRGQEPKKSTQEKRKTRSYFVAPSLPTYLRCFMYAAQDGVGHLV